MKLPINNKVDKKFIIINKIRLIFISLIFSILTSLFFDPFTKYWKLSIFILSISFLFIYLWYIPAIYKTIFYTLESTYIRISYGVIFPKNIFLKTSSISNVVCTQTLFQKIFNIKSVVFYTPGTTSWIVCINKKQLYEIIKYLENKQNITLNF